MNEIELTFEDEHGQPCTFEKLATVRFPLLGGEVKLEARRFSGFSELSEWHLLLLFMAKRHEFAACTLHNVSVELARSLKHDSGWACSQAYIALNSNRALMPNEKRKKLKRLLGEAVRAHATTWWENEPLAGQIAYWLHANLLTREIQKHAQDVDNAEHQLSLAKCDKEHAENELATLRREWKL